MSGFTLPGRDLIGLKRHDPSRRRVVIDGREIPGVVSVDPTRCLALVRELDSEGNPIPDGRGGYFTYRRAGKIEIIEDGQL